MLGYLPGGLIFGTMSDKFGRKPTFLICNMVRYTQLNYTIFYYFVLNLITVDDIGFLFQGRNIF